MNKISVAFYHGLGDCSNFAHQIPLWIRRGYAVDVECKHDKAPLFIAAGASIVPQAAVHHLWQHAAPPGRPTFDDHYSGNKAAWNLQHSVMPPLSYREVWDEHCAVRLDLDAFVTDLVRDKIEAFLRPLSRPLILVHPQGNTNPETKNLPDPVFIDLVAGLIDRTAGTVIVLDWDDRCPRIWNHRVRHIGDDLDRLSTVELYYLMKRAELFIGIDSGPAHFLRFTNTLGLVVWHAHYCSHYILPRLRTVNVVPRDRNDWTRFRRIPYNVVEYAELDGARIAEIAAGILAPGHHVAEPCPEAVLAGLLRRCRLTRLHYNNFVDRHRGFDLFLRHCRTFTNPTIVETGCMRQAEDFGAGMSTYLFAFFLHHHGGRLLSVDCDAAHVGLARSWTRWAGDACQPIHAHSHEWLRGYRGPPIDALYLDSADVDTPNYQECCLAEAQLAHAHLSERACILIDDTPFKRGTTCGKGTLAIPWLLSQRWRIAHAGYQILLMRA